MVLRCPELDVQSEDGEATFDFQKLDRIIKRCLPTDLELSGMVSALFTHECKASYCGGDNINPKKCKKCHFPHPECDVFTETEFGRFIPPGGVADTTTVSYNPTLVYRFFCHVNLDVVGPTGGVEYLYKYIHKGADTVKTNRGAALASGEEGNNASATIDQIGNYIKGKLITGTQASYQLIAKYMNQIKPAMIDLHVHGQAGFNIRYTNGRNDVEDVNEMLERNSADGSKTSKLLGFFRLNKRVRIYLQKKDEEEVSEEENSQYLLDVERGILVLTYDG